MARPWWMLGVCAVVASADAAPDAVTAASKANTPAAQVDASWTVDGAALIAKHRARLAADRSPVTVLEGGTPLELGQKICEQVVPARPATTPIVIKPNLGGFDWFHDPKTHHGDDGVQGRITDVDFTRGIVRCLKARGHTKIVIADGFTGVAADWQRLVRVSGYAKMADEEGVQLVALDDDGVFDKQGDQPGKPIAIRGIEKSRVPTLLMPKLLAEALDHGLLITAPKLKAHRFAVVSLGIKGLQGQIMYSDASPAFRQKWRSHREIDGALAKIKQAGATDNAARAAYVAVLEIFAQRMTDVLELEAPDVELVDGSPAMSGDGFEKMIPSKEHVAIGGTNVIAVDKVGAQLLGLWDNAQLAHELGGHATSPLIEVAAQRLGVELGAVKIVGNGAPLVATPRAADLIAMAGFEVRGDAMPAAAAAPQTPTPEFHAVRVDGAPTNATWASAPALAFSTNWAGSDTPIHTRVRALWSPHALYMQWELADTGLHTDHSRPIDREREDLYEEDCVELFLAPDAATPKRYAEIELGPFGHFFDIWVDRTGAKPTSDEAWSGKLQIATRQDASAHTAVIEVAIEAPEIVAALQAGASLPIGLYRMEGRDQRFYLAAYPTHTPRPNFHVPSAFGRLRLDP